jgi:Zn-dependent protease/CBS domain-containing protein
MKQIRHCSLMRNVARFDYGVKANFCGKPHRHAAEASAKIGPTLTEQKGISMGWSIRLFNVAGTAVRIHLTFFLLLAVFGGLAWQSGGASAAVSTVLFIVLLFVCVVLHEFGHVFAARAYGIRTSDVTLLPIGGVASLERMPEKPGQEIVVALAGPAVNLVIAALLIGVLGAKFDLTQMAQLERATATMTGRVAAANVALCLFNLIPAFPMDGGRVLRALLAIPLGFTRATRVAALVGQGLAFVFAIVGLLIGNPLLVLVAVFVFLAASGEAGYVQAREYTRGYLASHAMITSFQTLSPAAIADDAAGLLLRTTQQEFPLVDGAGQLRGFLTRDALIGALQRTGGTTPVLDIMDREVPTVPENACLDHVFERLQRAGSRLVGVVDGQHRLVGYITAENLSELILIKSARASGQAPAAATRPA